MEAKSPTHTRNGTAIEAVAAENRRALRLWTQTVAGTEGRRGGMPERPDDAVAYRLLEAAGQAFGRGERQKSVHIIELVARDYPQSKEAAFARTVLDRLRERQEGR